MTNGKSWIVVLLAAVTVWAVSAGLNHAQSAVPAGGTKVGVVDLFRVFNEFDQTEALNEKLQQYKSELAALQRSDRLTCQVTVDNIPGGTCWDGDVGLITKLIGPLTIDPARTTAVVVGPPIMYKYVIQELYEKNLPAENIIVSLERYMKCGVGKCGHCTIDHVYCCTDGPVFTLDQISSLKGAI